VVTVDARALPRFAALCRRPRTATAWRAIASRLIAAAIGYTKFGELLTARRCVTAAERALAYSFAAPTTPAPRSIPS
jgi:hypothetical protein